MLKICLHPLTQAIMLEAAKYHLIPLNSIEQGNFDWVVDLFVSMKVVVFISVNISSDSQYRNSLLPLR